MSTEGKIRLALILVAVLALAGAWNNRRSDRRITALETRLSLVESNAASNLKTLESEIRAITLLYMQQMPLSNIYTTNLYRNAQTLTMTNNTEAFYKTNRLTNKP